MWLQCFSHIRWMCRLFDNYFGVLLSLPAATVHKVEKKQNPIQLTSFVEIVWLDVYFSVFVFHSVLISKRRQRRELCVWCVHTLLNKTTVQTWRNHMIRYRASQTFLFFCRRRRRWWRSFVRFVRFRPFATVSPNYSKYLSLM